MAPKQNAALDSRNDKHRALHAAAGGHEGALESTETHPGQHSHPLHHQSPLPATPQRASTVVPLFVCSSTVSAFKARSSVLGD